MHEDNPYLSIEVDKIRASSCPVANPCWEGAESLTPALVFTHFECEDFYKSQLGANGSPSDHAGRIAWLMHAGWKDHISIDVGVPWMMSNHSDWIVVDGNHRLYAAILLEHKTILAEVSGCLDTAADLLNQPKLLEASFSI